MTKKTYTQKDGTIWEWEETVETSKELKNYYKLVKQNAGKATN